MGKGGMGIGETIHIDQFEPNEAMHLDYHLSNQPGAVCDLSRYEVTNFGLSQLGMSRVKM